MTANAFQKELDDLKEAGPPTAIATALVQRIPAGNDNFQFFKRQKGGGSFGHRLVVRGWWRGGSGVREAKAFVPSSWDWAYGTKGKRHFFTDLAEGIFQISVPFLGEASGFIICTIAADSNKIDLSRGAARAFGPRLLAAMGADLAAIHLAGPVTKDQISKDLRRRKGAWLLDAAQRPEAVVRADYREWRRLV